MRWALLLVVACAPAVSSTPREYLIPPPPPENPPDWDRAAVMTWDRLGDLAPFLGGADVSARPRLLVVEVDCLTRVKGCLTASSGPGMVMVASEGRRPSESGLALQLCRAAAFDVTTCNDVGPELDRELAAAGL